MELGTERAEALLEAFPESAFYRRPLEVVRLDCSRETRGPFNLIHHERGTKADVYPTSRDRLHRWGLAHRRRVPLGTGELSLARAEHAIVRKLEF